MLWRIIDQVEHKYKQGKGGEGEDANAHRPNCGGCKHRYLVGSDKRKN